MLACIRYQKRLGAYMDGELPGRKQAAVERHLTKCVKCRVALNDLRELKPLLQTLDAPPMPADLTARILAGAYDAKKPATKQSIQTRAEGLALPGWLPKGATAAALIIGLTMGAFMGWSSFPADRPAPSRMTASADISADNLLYAYDAMGAAPQDSIEAAALNLLEDKR